MASLLLLFSLALSLAFASPEKGLPPKAEAPPQKTDSKAVSNEVLDRAATLVPEPARIVGELFEGMPRLLRDLYGSEVFFKDLSESYFLSREPVHNDQYQLIQRAIAEGRKIKFRADPKTREIFSVDEILPKQK